MNGATEATLADLLATAQAMNVNLIKLQQLVKSSGSSLGSGAGGALSATGGSGGGGLSGLAVAANIGSAALSTLKTAAGAVGSVLGVMGSILGQVIGVGENLVKSLYSLGAATAITGTKISDFYATFENVFKNIPFLGLVGSAFGVLSNVFKYQEQLLEFFQQIAKSGATFSGSLFDMKAAASRAYMSIQDFATIVKSNSDVFATMSGTVMTGVNRFVDAQNKMLGPRSEYANMIYGFGFNAKTAGDLLASYMRNQAMVSKEEQQSTEELIKGTADYARNLNTLSQLTGKDIDTVKKEAEEIAKESAYQIYKTTITGKRAQDELEAITSINAALGKSIADQLRDSYSENVTRTKEQQIAATYSNNMTTELVGTVKNMLDSGQGMDKVNAYIMQQSLIIGKVQQDNFNALQGSRAFIDKSVSNALLPGILYANGQKDLITLQKNEAKIKKEQADAARGQAASLERAEQAMRNFG